MVDATVLGEGGPLAIVSLFAWDEAAVRATLRDALGLDLPEPGRWTAADKLVAVWLAPRHWSLQRAGTAPLLPQLSAILGGAAGLIEQTAGRATFRLAGPAAREILAGLVPIDLHPRGFAPGRAATTLAGHMTVQLRQLDTAPAYEISVGASFAGSLRRALHVAGAGRLAHTG